MTPRIPINPLQLAGGYGHLQPMPITGEPGQNDRGTRVEVERITEATACTTRRRTEASA